MEEIHSTHTCFACKHPVPYAGHVFGGIVLCHGNETDATISVTGQSQNIIDLAIQLQCPKCGAVNQFKAKHQQ